VWGVINKGYRRYQVSRIVKSIDAGIKSCHQHPICQVGGTIIESTDGPEMRKAIKMIFSVEKPDPEIAREYKSFHVGAH
jgi:hypothetical protein